MVVPVPCECVCGGGPGICSSSVPWFASRLVMPQGTFNPFPRHYADPYTTTHVGYTMSGLYKGKLRRPLVTYKNKTRTAVADHSLPS